MFIFGAELVQLTPALTDFKGPTIFICYRRISVIANIENKEIFFKRSKNCFGYRRISVTGGSVRAGFNCKCKVSTIDKKISCKKTSRLLTIPPNKINHRHDTTKRYFHSVFKNELYTRLCLSVGQSVGRLVHLFVTLLKSLPKSFVSKPHQCPSPPVRG